MLEELRLIKSVIFSMQTFYTHIFSLPKITQTIEQICKRFLWTGKAEISMKAPWHGKLRQPQPAEGLNFINIMIWNRAAICKL